jgi:hypothetical protein
VKSARKNFLNTALVLCNVNCDQFPLTLALSPKGRGEQLPLPEGEGWGEGGKVHAIDQNLCNKVLVHSFGNKYTL